MADISVSVAPEVLAQVGPFAITNSIVATVFTSLLIILVALFVRRGAGIIPSRSQVLFEVLYEFIFEKMVQIFGDEEKAMKFFPLMFTIFLFLLVANQFTMLPFVQTVVTEGGVEFLRTPTSDYSLPITLTLMILVLANGLAFMQSPLRYIGNFINFKGFVGAAKTMKSAGFVAGLKELPMAALDLFMGLMDIIGELAKVVSLGTRLFGNIFAGEVLVAVIMSLMAATQFIAPLPFLGLSVLSGFVQAFVFTILGIIYLNSSIESTRRPLEA